MCSFRQILEYWRATVTQRPANLLIELKENNEVNQPGFNVRAADIRGANVWGEVAGWLSIEQPDQVDAVALVDHAISGHLPGFRMGPSC